MTSSSSQHSQRSSSQRDSSLRNSQRESSFRSTQRESSGRRSSVSFPPNTSTSSLTNTPNSYLDRSAKSAASTILTDIGFHTPLITAQQRRLDMITNELDGLFAQVQDYFLARMMDEYTIIDEVQAACVTAASLPTMAYIKKYTVEDETNVVYIPTCRKLIVKGRLLDVAGQYYHPDEADGASGLPPAFVTALQDIVTTTAKRRLSEKHGRTRSKKNLQASSRRRQQMANFFNNESDAEDSIGSHDSDRDEEEDADTTSLGSSFIGSGSGHSSHGKMDSEMMEQLGQSWREAIDPTVQHRLSLC